MTLLLWLPLLGLSPACAGDPGPGETDAGDPTRCDPVSGGGCGAAEKCSLRVDSEDPYLTTVTCLPDGTQALGQPCGFESPGPYGSDNCVAGSFCLSGVCAAICEPAAPGCGDAACVRYEAVFEDRGLGICTPRCDPNAALACGDGQGCYLGLASGVASCHPAGAGQGGDRCELIDACAPGLGCVLLAPDGASTRCAHFCDPATATTAAGSSCAEALTDVGAPRCVRVDRFYNDADAVDDQIGMCIDCAIAEYAEFAVCNQ
ncbi:MAG: hypothetical protein Tsb0020_31430 [Haliangiales bacterium]